METTKTSTTEKTRWEDLRDTIKGGVRDLRNVGDEIARQGRVRMDIYQTERRLKTACEELGKATHARFVEGQIVSGDDPSIAELSSRVTYYMSELKRLHDDLQPNSGNMN